MNKNLVNALCYIFILFISPSISLTLLLLNDYGLPHLSAVSSERFWIYLVESKRAVSNGLLSWPGNLLLTNSDWIYLERFLIRVLYLAVNLKYFLIFDASASATCFLLGMLVILKRYYGGLSPQIQVAILLTVAVQPIYLTKALLLDTAVIDLWYGRGLVASLAFILFTIGIHELIFKKNLALSLVVAIFLGLLHSYTFILYIGTYVLYVTYSSFVKPEAFNRFLIAFKMNLLMVTICIILLLLILFNLLLFKLSPDISYFFNRYIPLDRDRIHIQKDFMYLSLYIIITVLMRYSLKDTVASNLNVLTLFTIAAALIIDLLLFLVAPQAINIHFRIYIIEPLFLMNCIVLLGNYLQNSIKWISAGIFFISLSLLFNQFRLVSASITSNGTSVETVHHYIFKNDLDECRCTIFDPFDAEFVNDKLEYFESGSAHSVQWENAILHLGRFGK